MRGMLTLMAGAATLLASSPSFAGPCPATREEGLELLASLSRTGDDACCGGASRYDASGQKAFGVQPLAILDRVGRQGRLNAVIFVLPGALGKYAAGFKKAFPQAYCNSASTSCDLSIRNEAPGTLRQVLLGPGVTAEETYFHCNFIMMD